MDSETTAIANTVLATRQEVILVAMATSTSKQNSFQTRQQRLLKRQQIHKNGYILVNLYSL